MWHKKLSYSTALEDTKALMALIGRDPSDYGEHSGRRGGATAASEAGVSWIDLKRHGRWASDSAPQRYIEQTAKRTHAVAAALANESEERNETRYDTRNETRYDTRNETRYETRNEVSATRYVTTETRNEQWAKTVHGYRDKRRRTDGPTQIWNEAQQ